MYTVGLKSTCLVCRTIRPLGLGFWLRDIMTESIERSLLVREGRPREERLGSLAALLVMRGMAGNDLMEALLDVRRLLGRCGAYMFLGEATDPLEKSDDARTRSGRTGAGVVVGLLAGIAFAAVFSFC